MHHQLLPPEIRLAAPPEAFWERALPATIARVPVRVLAPDDLVLHVALHLACAHHFVGGIDRLRDLAEVTRHYGEALDWERMAGTAAGMERPLYAALWMARQFVGAPVPDGVLARLRAQGGVSALEERCLAVLGQRLALRTGPDDGLVPTWLLTACMEELVERRSWTGRGVRLARTVLDVWAGEGRKRGYGRWSLLYGVFVHPWRGWLRRRERHAAGS